MEQSEHIAQRSYGGVSMVKQSCNQLWMKVMEMTVHLRSWSGIQQISQINNHLMVILFQPTIVKELMKELTFQIKIFRNWVKNRNRVMMLRWLCSKFRLISKVKKILFNGFQDFLWKINANLKTNQYFTFPKKTWIQIDRMISLAKCKSSLLPKLIPLMAVPILLIIKVSLSFLP